MHVCFCTSMPRNTKHQGSRKPGMFPCHEIVGNNLAAGCQQASAPQSWLQMPGGTSAITFPMTCPATFLCLSTKVHMNACHENGSCLALAPAGAKSIFYHTCIHLSVIPYRSLWGINSLKSAVAHHCGVAFVPTESQLHTLFPADIHRRNDQAVARVSWSPASIIVGETKLSKQVVGVIRGLSCLNASPIGGRKTLLCVRGVLHVDKIEISAFSHRVKLALDVLDPLHVLRISINFSSLI